MKSCSCSIGIGAVAIALLLAPGCKRQPAPTATTPQSSSKSGPSTLGEQIQQIHQLLNATPAKTHWISVAPGMQRLEGLPEFRSEAVTRSNQVVWQKRGQAFRQYVNVFEATWTLRQAAIEGNVKAATEALERGANLRWADEVEGATPLHWASYGGHEAMVQLLLDRGADIDARTKFGRTPLHWAAMNGKGEVVDLLLEAGADAEVKDRRGQTALDLASQGSGLNALVSREVLGTPSALKGAQRDQMGRTALHQAVLENRPHMAALLIAKHADLNAVDQQGRTPLHLAVTYDRKELVKLLLSKGARPDVADPYGLTPIFESRSAEVARTLLNWGARADPRDKTGQTPLHWAAAYGREDVENVLKIHGADALARDRFGRTPADVKREEAGLRLAGAVPVSQPK